jgi:hypothetical protein
MEAHSKLAFSTPAEKVAASLAAISAFFFGMRSCEYTQVTGERRTRQLRLQNLRFFRDNRAMALNNPDLLLATAISITFEFKKTDVRNKTVHQHATFLLVLCPILQWATIVQRVLAYPDCVHDSLVSTVVNDQRKLITGQFLGTQVKAAAACGGSEDTLKFVPDDIGTHSIRSGAAMVMYLAGVPVDRGRWSSDAFLRYIRRQVLQFSDGVSTQMVSAESQNFFTLPDVAPEHPRTKSHHTHFHSPPHSGPKRQKPSTPDHVFESLLPRFELSI